jgi:chromatin remodeling complex protein RSC6
MAKKATTSKSTTTTKATATKAAAKPKAAAGTKRVSTALMKPVNVSTDLQAIVGSKSLPRTEVTKKVWEYIRTNKLQDPKAKRNINADAKLSKVLDNKKTVNMFEMTKLINKHLS